MNAIDPGHVFTLDSLDGEQENKLIFVKREGDKYPGNVGHHPGTTMQEVLRALISRTEYVNAQLPDAANETAILHMKLAIYQFEARAATRHGRQIVFTIDDVVKGVCKCETCGHVACRGRCRK